MLRRPLAHVGAELAGRITAIEIARAQLFDVDVDRRKRIDDAIDYFGGAASTARKGLRQLGSTGRRRGGADRDRTPRGARG